MTIQVKEESPPDSQNRIYYPEDRLPLVKLIPMGIQHVIAMFGGTVLAPILMGFDPQITLFFSGIGTLLFILVTGLKVPSYLGSSFAFIGPILAITGGNASKIPYALCGIAGAAVLYALAAVATMRWGPSWIDRLMPPLVTGSVVAIIGLNLAGTVVSDAINNELTINAGTDWTRVMIASVTFFTAAFVSIWLRGFLQMVPILIGVMIGCAVAAACGMLDPQRIAQVESAPWIGLPPFQTPAFSWGALMTIAPVFIVLVAENKGHIAAISSYMGRDLNPYLGRAYLGDALATLISSFGGGTPQTTYAENMGVMAMTRVFSTHNFIAAAVIALLLGLCPKFGAFIQTIPNPVLGGITLLIYGIIALMGIRIWMDAKVDFTRHKNLAVAGASLIVATGLGTKGLTVAGMNIPGIALGTVLALVLNWVLSIGNQE
jgi:putative pyrimidine permease RutG